MRVAGFVSYQRCGVYFEEARARAHGALVPCVGAVRGAGAQHCREGLRIFPGVRQSGRPSQLLVCRVRSGSLRTGTCA